MAVAVRVGVGVGLAGTGPAFINKMQKLKLKLTESTLESVLQ